ncbi:MAG: F0F1 ATP synthase subunit A [Planctomycetes bacterium]|nr:F0F1 ATP synthase subunit A [Planctomycetota bacterium]
MTEEAHGSSSGGVPELPTFFDLLPIDKHAEIFGLTPHQLLPIVMSLMIIAFLGFFSMVATRNLKKVPGGLQAILEILVEALDGFVESILGKMSGKFLPFIGTLFLYILIMNLIGQVPLLHSPTTNYNTTLALTLLVFFATHYYGLKHNGPVKYVKHMMGEPRWMSPMLFPLHLLSEFLTRPLSLSMRLYGNLMGGHTVLSIFIGLSPLLLGLIPIPIHFPFVLLDLLLASLQAFIFAFLASFYIAGSIGEQHL